MTRRRGGGDGNKKRREKTDADVVYGEARNADTYEALLQLDIHTALGSNVNTGFLRVDSIDLATAEITWSEVAGPAASEEIAAARRRLLKALIQQAEQGRVDPALRSCATLVTHEIGQRLDTPQIIVRAELGRHVARFLKRVLRVSSPPRGEANDSRAEPHNMHGY